MCQINELPPELLSKILTETIVSEADYYSKDSGYDASFQRLASVCTHWHQILKPRSVFNSIERLLLERGCKIYMGFIAKDSISLATIVIIAVEP